MILSENRVASSGGVDLGIFLTHPPRRAETRLFTKRPQQDTPVSSI
jgi:hypothetical protein